MIICHQCRNWYHSSCLKVDLTSVQLLPGDYSYAFECGACRQTVPGVEEFRRYHSQRTGQVHIALYNLHRAADQQQHQQQQQYFDIKADIEAFLQEHWQTLEGKNESLPKQFTKRIGE